MFMFSFFSVITIQFITIEKIIFNLTYGFGQKKTITDSVREKL